MQDRLNAQPGYALVWLTIAAPAGVTASTTALSAS